MVIYTKYQHTFNMDFKSLGSWLLHKCQLLNDSLSYLSSIPQVKAASSTIIDYAFSELKEIITRLHHGIKTPINPELHHTSSQLTDVYEKQVAGLRAELQAIRKDKDELESFYEGELNKLRQIELEIGRIRTEEKDREEASLTLKKEVHRLSTALEDARFELTDLKGCLANRQELLQVGRERIKRMEKQIDSQNESLRRAKTNSSVELIDFAQQLQKSRICFENALEQSERDNRELSLLLQKTAEKVSELTDLQLDKEAQLRILGEKNQDTTVNLQAANKQIQQLTRELSQELERRNLSDRNLEQSENVISTLQQRLTLSSEALLQAKQESLSNQHQKQTLEKQLKSYQHDCQRLKQQVVKLDREKIQLLGQFEMVRNSLKKGHENLNYLERELYELKVKAKQKEKNFEDEQSNCVNEFNTEINKLVLLLQEAGRKVEISQSQLSQRSIENSQNIKQIEQYKHHICQLRTCNQQLLHDLKSKEQQLQDCTKAKESAEKDLIQQKKVHDQLVGQNVELQEMVNSCKQKALQSHQLQEERRRLRILAQSKTRQIEKVKEEVDFWKEQSRKESVIYQDQKKKAECKARQLYERCRIELESAKIDLKRQKQLSSKREQELSCQMERLKGRVHELQSITDHKTQLLSRSFK